MCSTTPSNPQYSSKHGKDLQDQMKQGHLSTE